MAHLPNDQLPGEFDIIVVGTGLIQCLIASAAARVGKAVLHLDSNFYYGEYWGTLMHRDLQEWLGRHRDNQLTEANEGDIPHEVNEVEKLVACKDSLNNVTNIVEINHNANSHVIIPASNNETTPTYDEATPINNETVPTNNETKPTDDEATPINNETKPTDDEAAPTNNEVVPTDDETTPIASDGGVVKKTTWDSLETQRRRFNFDLLPKLLYCRGQMVDIIVQSGVSRYLEFKSIPKIYCYTKDKEIVQVPCSRADVFNSKIVTMLEKRKLMKVLTFCSEFEQHTSQYENFINQPFTEFLKSQDLTENLIYFIIHSIAMVDYDTPTLEGLKATRVFLQSLGRFGNAPFLYPLFGSGELPQGFCRLCAVFGGVYCLKRSVHSLVTSVENKLSGVICTTGQRIKCSILVGSAGLLPCDQISYQMLSRAIFVTDGPISQIHEKIHLLIIPPRALSDEQRNKINVLQIDETSLNTSSNTYMIHATCISYLSTAQEDLQIVANELFNSTRQTDDTRPHLLWSLYYNMKVAKVHSYTGLPENVAVVSDPDPSIAYETCIAEARQLFNGLYPGEEFLPKMPEPEDIIYSDNIEGESNAVAPSDDRVNEQEVVPSNDGVNEQEDVPSNDGVNEQEVVPSNDGINEQEVIPSNNGVNKQEVVPNNDGVNEQEVVPVNEETDESTN